MSDRTLLLWLIFWLGVVVGVLFGNRTTITRVKIVMDEVGLKVLSKELA